MCHKQLQQKLSMNQLFNKLVQLRSPYNMRPWHVNKTKDTARPQG